MCNKQSCLALLALIFAVVSGCRDEGVIKEKEYGSNLERIEIALFGNGCRLGFTDDNWHEGRVLVIDGSDAPTLGLFQKMLRDAATWKYDQVAVYYPEGLIFDFKSAEMLNKLENVKILNVYTNSSGAETIEAINRINLLRYVCVPWKPAEKEFLEKQGITVFPKNFKIQSVSFKSSFLRRPTDFQITLLFCNWFCRSAPVSPNAGLSI